MNKYIDIIISQNTTQFYAQYVQYISQIHVSANFRPKHVVVRYIVRIVHNIVLCVLTDNYINILKRLYAYTALTDRIYN